MIAVCGLGKGYSKGGGWPVKYLNPLLVTEIIAQIKGMGMQNATGCNE